MRRILILGRVGEKNLGDTIIIDTCAYMLEKLARDNFKKISVTVVDMLSKDKGNIQRIIKDYDAVVFPGGGVNSLHFSRAAKEILKGNEKTEIFFNANGISASNSAEIKANLTELMNNPNTVQVTTRGDYLTAQSYVKDKKKYPVAHVLDPAVFSSETYNIRRNLKSDIVGVGLIRPEIFRENGKNIAPEQVEDMYEALLSELDKRGEKWELFCNGMAADYDFAKKLLEKTNRPLSLLADKPQKNKELIKLISGYKGIIASRFHANIIATSLEVPSIALVWNNKMLGFAELIGCTDRYITDESVLANAKKLVDKLENAIDTGYDKKRIDKAKMKTKKEMSHIVGKCFIIK